MAELWSQWRDELAHALLAAQCKVNCARHVVPGNRCAARGARQTRVLAGYARLRIEGSIVINLSSG